MNPGTRSEADRGRGGVLDDVLTGLVREVGASAGMLYLLDPSSRVLRMALTSGVSRRIVAPWTIVPADATSPVADAVRRRRLVWVAGREEMARRYPQIGLVAPYDFMLAAAPVTSGSVAWGGCVLLVPASHGPELGEDEREAVAAACDLAARHLRAAADSGHPLQPSADTLVAAPPESSEAELDEARAALRFTRRLLSGCCSLDLDGRIDFLDTAAAQMLGAGAPESLGRRPWEAFPWLRSSPFEGRYRAAAFTRRPTSFTAARRPDEGALHFTLYPDESGTSVQISPAEAPAEPASANAPQWGAHVVGSTTLYHLTHLAVTLSEALHVEDVVELAADQMVPAFGVDAVAIAVAEDGRLRIAGHRGYGPEVVAHHDGLPLSATGRPAVRAVDKGEAAFYATPGELRDASPEPSPHDGMASWAFLPLTVSGRTLGVLDVAYRTPHAFSRAERATLASLAGIVAQALERARLYDTQHTLARSLQNGLLPRTLPQVPGLTVTARYRTAGPGADIGGDFYDLIRPSPTTAVAVIGDVQGHNSAAAALMGQVRTAVHAFATLSSTPGATLAAANQLLTELDSTLFASCFVAQVDLAAGRALVASAGHLPALLRHPDGSTTTVAPDTGLLLGIDAHSTYPSEEFLLPDHSVLALYTDGLVERPGVDIDDAVADLARCLSGTAPDDLEAAADTLVRHSEGATLSSDDLALLLLRPGPGEGAGVRR
jgi:PAS domain-containing protein/uncharacterized protein YigA (DUF484 family)